MPEPELEEEVTGHHDEIEEEKDPKSSDEDGKSADEKESSEVDALKAQLRTVNRALKKFDTEREEREQRELEDKGEHKKIIEKQKATISALEGEAKQAQRDASLQLEVLDRDIGFSKAGLIKKAKRIDRETKGEKELSEIVDLAIEEAKELTGSDGTTETQSWGTSGSGAGRKDTRGDELSTLKELRKDAEQGDERKKYQYLTLRRKLLDEGVKIPG